MHILIFDIDITGHHSEYIKHLVTFIKEKAQHEHYIFVVHPQFSITFPDIIINANKVKNIQFTEITATEYRKCKSKNTIIQSFKIYNLMNKYAKNKNAETIHLMTLNIFQLALGFTRQKYLINGILFRPFSRMDKNTFIDRLKYFRKFIQTWLLVCNRRIKRVFILNDLKTVEFLNKKFKTNIFEFLSDPVSELSAMPGFLIKDNFNIESDRKIILHFGSLSERKGTLDILDAYNFLEIKDISKIALLLIGKANKTTENKIQEKIVLLKQKYHQAVIIFQNEFINDSMMKSYFDQCDIVIIPYKNIESSSGVIGHAISSCKPVIATNKGLLGELVRENNLGWLIEDSNPILISEAIQLSLSSSLSTINNINYLTSHSPEKFAKKMIEK